LSAFDRSEREASKPGGETVEELTDRDVLLQFSEPSSRRLGFAEPHEFPDCSAKTTAMNRLLLLQTAAPVDYDGQRCGCDAGGGGEHEAFSVCGDVIGEVRKSQPYPS